MPSGHHTRNSFPEAKGQTWDWVLPNLASFVDHINNKFLKAFENISRKYRAIIDTKQVHKIYPLTYCGPLTPNDDIDLGQQSVLGMNSKITNLRLQLLHLPVAHELSWNILATITLSRSVNKMNPGYFSLTAIHLKPQQMPIFLHIPWDLGALVISANIRTIGIRVQTGIILYWNYLCVTDCTCIENMAINFIQMGLYNTSPGQAILYQFKRYEDARKRLGCPQRMQRTWWQIMATPDTGFTVFEPLFT